MTKTVKVYSNDSSNPLAQLKITAFGEESGMKCEWTPEMADFGEVLINHKAKMKLGLKNNDSSEVRLEVVSEPTAEYVKKYRLKKDHLMSQKSTELEVELQPDIPLGAFKTALTLQAEGNPQTRFTIPITGTVVEKLTPKEEIEKGKASNSQAEKPKTTTQKNVKPSDGAVPQKTVKDDKSGNSGSK